MFGIGAARIRLSESNLEIKRPERKQVRVNVGRRHELGLRNPSPIWRSVAVVTVVT